MTHEIEKEAPKLNGLAAKKELETPQEHYERIKSLIIVYFTLFLQSLGLAIVMPGLLPYYEKLDSSATKGFYSLIVAANPLGQFIFSPILGFWTNKSSSIRSPIISSLVIFCVSSLVYSCLGLFDSGANYWMLIARFFMGAASANIAVSRSYIAAASKVDERTFYLSMASLSQVSGFIVGPLLQAAFTAIPKGIFLFGKIPFSMYTAPGWVNVVFGLVNMCIFVPKLFKDSNIAMREESMSEKKESTKVSDESSKLDYLSIFSLILSYFIVTFNLVILESLSTPLSMDQFAFSHKEAMKWNGILIGIGAAISCIIFCLLPKVCKLLKEIDILIWGGLLIMAMGKLIYIPFYGDIPKLTMESRNDTLLARNDDSLLNETSTKSLGCPVRDQEWCAWTPALGIPEYVIGYFMGVIGYPVGMTLIQTLFSKILGARPQGTWMGWMVASGSVARIIGPIIILGGYTKFGISWTFAVITAVMLVPMVNLFCIRKRILSSVLPEDIPITEIKSAK